MMSFGMLLYCPEVGQASIEAILSPDTRTDGEAKVKRIEYL